MDPDSSRPRLVSAAMIVALAGDIFDFPIQPTAPGTARRELCVRT